MWELHKLHVWGSYSHHKAQESHCSAKETWVGVNRGWTVIYREMLWISQPPKRYFHGWKIFLTKNTKKLSRIISKSVTFYSPEIIFDFVRHQIRPFVCLFLSYAPKMEIQKKWSLLKMLIGLFPTVPAMCISLRWLRFCWMGFFQICCNQRIYVFLSHLKSNQNLHVVQIKFLCRSVYKWTTY